VFSFSVRLAARPKSGVARYAKSSWTYSPLRFLCAVRLGFQPFAQSGLGDVNITLATERCYRHNNTSLLGLLTLRDSHTDFAQHVISNFQLVPDC